MYDNFYAFSILYDVLAAFQPTSGMRPVYGCILTACKNGKTAFFYRAMHS